MRERDVLTWLGIDPEGNGAGENSQDEGGELRVGIVVRVSTNRQMHRTGEGASESSFEHQRQRLLDFIQTDERFRGKRTRITEFHGKAVSGLNLQADHLRRLLDAVLAHKLDYVVVQDASRLARFGSSFIEAICRAHKCELVYSMPAAIDDDLVTDVLNIIQSYASKSQSLKSALVTRRDIDPETLQEASRLHRQQGLSIRAIYAKLKAEGRNRCQRTQKAFSYRTLHRALTGTKGELLAEAIPDDGKPNSFERFIREKLSRQKNASLSRPEVMNPYAEYCAANGLPIVSERTAVSTWRKMKGTITRPLNITTYCGYAFKE